MMAPVGIFCFAAATLVLFSFATVNAQLPPITLPSIPPISGLPSLGPGQSTTHNPNAVYRKRVYDVHIYARLVKGLREVNQLLKQFPVLGPLAGQLLGPGGPLGGLLGGQGGAGGLLGGLGGAGSPLGAATGLLGGALGGVGGRK